MPHSFIEALDKIVKADLLNWRDAWFHRLLWSTAAVALGLAFEGPELWCELRRIWLDRRDRRMFFALTPHEIPPRWKMLAFAGWILIVLGVAGEGIFEAMVSRVDGQLQTFNDILLQDAQQEAASAKESAGAAYERAATTEKEAAEDLKVTNIARQKAEEARQETEELRKKNLELEALIEPRDLSSEQSKAIANALMEFRGKWVLVLVMEDPETMRFGEIIAATLRGGTPDLPRLGSGPLNTETSILAEGFTIPPRTGVEVDGQNQQLVEALRNALFSIGHIEQTPKAPRMNAGGYLFKPNPTVPPDATVYVGLKPVRFLQQNGSPP